MATQYSLTELVWAAPGLTGTVTATITAPDGTVQVVAATTAALLHPGAATAWFTPQQAGTYTVAWSSTSGQAGTSSVAVDAPVVAQVMSLNDCYDTLKVPRSQQGANPDRDADMLAYARAAAGVVEGIVGPIAPQTITEVLDARGPALLLRAKPSAILSVTVNGQPYSGWVPDLAAGILYASGYAAGWQPGFRNIEVVYTAGSGQVKPNVLLGIREVFRQLWERSRSLGGGASSDLVLQGFAVPNAVRELIGSEVALPGIA